MRDNLASLRHIGKPRLARRSVDSFVISGPIEIDLAAAHRQKTHDGFQRRRLADTISAHQARDLAGSDGERDIPQNMAFAVIDVDLL